MEIMDKETAREVREELKQIFKASPKDQLFYACADYIHFLVDFG